MTVPGEYVNPFTDGYTHYVEDSFSPDSVRLCLRCARSQVAPDALVWTPEAPFARDEKIEIPSEAVGLFHFLKGQLLLGQGDFDEALKEFEAAARANPADSFLHFRLATSTSEKEISKER